MVCPNCGSVQADCIQICPICGFQLAEEVAKMKESSAEEKIEIRSYTALFDEKKFGVNYSVGIAYFMAMIMVQFFFMLIVKIEHHSFYFTYLFNLYFFISSIIMVSLFIFLNHKIKKEYHIPLFLGIFASIISLIFILIKGEDRFIIERLIIQFLDNSLFILILILTIKKWGPQLLILVAGIILINILISILIEFLWYRPINNFLLNFFFNCIKGVIYGGLLFYGLKWHFNQKGYQLANGNLYKKSN